MEQKVNRYSVPALEKTLSIMEALAVSGVPLGISDIAARINLPKSSIYMILTTLEEHHYIEKNADGKYRLTLKLYHLGLTVLNKIDIRDIARPIMEELARQLGYTVHLAALVDGKAVYIEKVQGPAFVQFSTQVGQSWHLHSSGVGKAIAAYISEEQLDEVLQKHGMPQSTPNTILSEYEFKTFLESVRKSGYAIEDEEGEQGIRCIAAPIYDRNRKVIAAISVTSVRLDLPSHRFSEVGVFVKDKALLISEKLGYTLEDSDNDI